MISPQLLQRLCCPLDPHHQARLLDEETRLVCEQCGLRFGIRDGLPNLVVDEAELPPGCTRLDQLISRHQQPSAKG
jgi:uncharacterized protein YbaR (Trm112 family)